MNANGGGPRLDARCRSHQDAKILIPFLQGLAQNGTGRQGNHISPAIPVLQTPRHHSRGRIRIGSTQVGKLIRNVLQQQVERNIGGGGCCFTGGRRILLHHLKGTPGNQPKSRRIYCRDMTNQGCTNAHTRNETTRCESPEWLWNSQQHTLQYRIRTMASWFLEFAKFDWNGRSEWQCCHWCR